MEHENKIRAKAKSKTSKYRLSDSKINTYSKLLNSPPIQIKTPKNEKKSQNWEKFQINTISKTHSFHKENNAFRRLSTMQIPNSFLEPITNTNLSLEILKKEYENYPNGEYSKIKLNTIKSYSYNSYHGLVKKENEDRIFVSTSVKKPNNKKNQNWPKISFFGIFDGHGGETCSSYLKHNFLNFLIEDKNFPNDIKESILNTVEKIEKEFNKKYIDILNNNIDLSGSCACIILIIDNKIYAINIGDSRAIISYEIGSKIQPLTIDHKPNNPIEYNRIIKIGGKVYIDIDDDDRDYDKLNFIDKENDFDDYIKENCIFRIYPCHLAVARTIGDLKAKNKNYGGLPGEIISIPDIYVYDISTNMDFIIIGCDGIYDNLTNEEIIDSAWFAIENCCKERKYDINLISLDACNMIIKNAMDKLSVDNLSVVFIGLDGMEKYIMHQKNKEIKNELKKK